MASGLTQRQVEVMAFLRSFKTECGFPPTRNEIAQHFKWKSPNAAEDHLRRLQRKGEVTIARGHARGLYFSDHAITEPQQAAAEH